MFSSAGCSRNLLLFCIIWSCISIQRCLSTEDSVNIGDECKNSEQCQNNTPNSTCSEGVCSCETGFFHFKRINSSSCESNDSLKTDEEYVENTNKPKVRQQQIDVKMVVIMVVLAVMFIGICVALHLFSKARFRNHRTIFNSPHPRLMHIKLGKKKGRRRTSLDVPGSRQLSICSQLSPIQSRSGSQTASPEISQKTRRSNGKDGVYTHHKSHKTDSSDKSSHKAHSEAVANGPDSPAISAANKGSKPCTSKRV